MTRILVSCLALIALAACQASDPQLSASRYASYETMSAAPVARCRVIDTRRVEVTRGEAPRSPYSRYGYSPRSTGPDMSTILGAAVGGAIGNQFGGGSGKVLATALGAAAGSALIAPQAKRLLSQPSYAVEYSVMTGPAPGVERIIVQPYARGDVVVPAGAGCRLSQSAGGLRVLPADHLPARVAAPPVTRYR